MIVQMASMVYSFWNILYILSFFNLFKSIRMGSKSYLDPLSFQRKVSVNGHPIAVRMLFQL